MRTTLSLLAASLLICLSGCSSSYGASGSGTVMNTLTGNWSATTSGPTVRQIGGYLQNNSGTITGTLHITNDTTCFPFNAATSNTPAEPENIPVTGTLTGTALALSGTAANSGQVFSISNGVVNSNNNALVSGNYSITGGCGSTTGTITGNQDTSFTFTYTGTLTSTGTAGTTTISANLL
jgi:hypothetical protein